jgi:hypothetical protein
MNLKNRTSRKPKICLALAALASTVMCLSSAQAADHRDGTIFPAAGNGNLDLNDLYLFKPNEQSKNTAMVMTTHPFAGVFSPITFNHLLNYEFKIDNNDNAKEDVTIRINFGALANGTQQVTVTRIDNTIRRPGCKTFQPKGQIIGRGNTGADIALRGGGILRAGLFDDPFFFDGSAFNRLLGAAPQVTGPNTGQIAPGDANSFANPGKNFFGPMVNTLAIVVELPSRQLTRGNRTQIGAWIRVSNVSDGGQVDRTGFPAINVALIPPVPRTDTSRGDRRTAFNVGLPRNDARDFRDDMIAVLTSPTGIYKRSATDAAGLADFLLPDILPFDTSSIGSFPNGRRLEDDVIDTELALLTGVQGLSDNVANDSVFLTTFPYLAAPNVPACGLNNACPM